MFGVLVSSRSLGGFREGCDAEIVVDNLLIGYCRPIIGLMTGCANELVPCSEHPTSLATRECAVFLVLSSSRRFTRRFECGNAKIVSQQFVLAYFRSDVWLKSELADEGRPPSELGVEGII
jgi:hypothetical protein